MAWDFTPDESDNSLYWNKLNTLDNQELDQEYRELMRSRGEGGDAEYNLRMCFDIIQGFYERRGLEFPSVPEDHTIFGYIKQTDTPESSSLEGYGYDFFEHTLYIKYKSNKKVYAFYEVPLERFNMFELSSSKGQDAALLRKEFGTKK